MFFAPPFPPFSEGSCCPAPLFPGGPVDWRTADQAFHSNLAYVLRLVVWTIELLLEDMERLHERVWDNVTPPFCCLTTLTAGWWLCGKAFEWVPKRMRGGGGAKRKPSFQWVASLLRYFGRLGGN